MCKMWRYYPDVDAAQCSVAVAGHVATATITFAQLASPDTVRNCGAMTSEYKGLNNFTDQAPEAYIQVVLVLLCHRREVERLPVIWSEACVHKLPEKGVVEQRYSKRLIVLQLVVAMDADGLKIASKCAHEHDQPGHHGCTRVVSPQNHDTTAPRSVSSIEMSAVQSLQEVRLVKFGWGIILTLEQVQLAYSNRAMTYL